MSELPPPKLVELLESLGLVLPEQFPLVARQVQRLARDLPRFESVWVDALARARLLTPFQAAEINAGRARELLVADFLLLQPVQTIHYGMTYRARHARSRQQVRLALIPLDSNRQAEFARGLSTLVARSSEIQSPRLLLAEQASVDQGRGYAVGPWFEARSVADWLRHQGRFHPAVVWEIARQMVAGLVDCEARGLAHGDISAVNLLLDARGRAHLVLPGLRASVRAEEGYAWADLVPEAYDYLAPERIADGIAANTASDIYACACLWWHLLAGRAPLAGANALARLQAAHQARIDDIRRHAPETPPSLAELITACLRPEPRRRPASFAELAALLGPPTRPGERLVSRTISRTTGHLPRLVSRSKSARWSRQVPITLACAAGCLVAAAVAVWPAWSKRPQSATKGTSRQRVAHAAPGKQIVRLDSSQRVDDPRDAAHEEDLVLESQTVHSVNDWRIKSGQTVRAPLGERSTLSMPLDGWAINLEDVHFENIDFVGDDSNATGDDQDSRTLINLRAAHATFVGCSFQSSRSERVSRTGIDWTPPGSPPDSIDTLPTAEIELIDCTFGNVSAGIRCESSGATLVTAENTLHLGHGPFVQLHRAPGLDDVVGISLDHCTLRACTSLLECPTNAAESKAGRLLVQATASVLACLRGGALISFLGSHDPSPWTANLEWTGNSNILTDASEIAIWRENARRVHALPEDDLSVAGLVRSRVDFAGNDLSRPEDSRAEHWLAPLRSAQPPGINVARLPSRTRRR